MSRWTAPPFVQQSVVLVRDCAGNGFLLLFMCGMMVAWTTRRSTHGPYLAPLHSVDEVRGCVGKGTFSNSISVGRRWHRRTVDPYTVRLLYRRCTLLCGVTSKTRGPTQGSLGSRCRTFNNETTQTRIIYLSTNFYTLPTPKSESNMLRHTSIPLNKLPRRHGHFCY